MKIWIRALALFLFSLGMTYAEEAEVFELLPQEEEIFFRDYSLWNLKVRDTLDRSLHPLNEKRCSHPILLITLPRSGTNFLIGSLSYGLTATKEWCGRFIGTPEVCGTVELEPLKDLLFYGGISWCHAEALPGVTSLLEKYDLPITVQMRDPRQAVLSFLYHMQKPLGKKEEELGTGNPFSEETIDAFLTFWFPRFVHWIEGWVKYAKAHPEKVQILFYEEMREDFPSHLEKILRFQGIDVREFDWSLDEIRKFWEANNLLHFRKGKKDEWRDFFNPSQIEYLNSLMPEEFFTSLPFER